MVMTRSTAIGSIVTGSILLGFAVISVICGAISASKMSGAAAASAGLWSLFVSVYFENFRRLKQQLFIAMLTTLKLTHYKSSELGCT